MFTAQKTFKASALIQEILALHKIPSKLEDVRLVFLEERLTSERSEKLGENCSKLRCLDEEGYLLEFKQEFAEIFGKVIDNAEEVAI